MMGGIESVCKMNLLGPPNALSQEDWLASWGVSVSSHLRPF